MSNFKHPRVYIEEIPSDKKPIEAVETCVTAFVGKTTKGPVSKAERIQSFNEYKRIYGDIASEKDTMGLAVQSFYLNGVRSAVICRLGSEGFTYLTVNDYTDFYEGFLEKIQDVSIVLTPGEYWAGDGSGNPVITATLLHCEKMQNRMAIIDPSPNVELDHVTEVNKLNLPSSPYSVLYYPWVTIANPFYKTNSRAEKTAAVAPSAFAAGIWCRTDLRQGVLS